MPDRMSTTNKKEKKEDIDAVSAVAYLRSLSPEERAKEIKELEETSERLDKVIEAASLPAEERRQLQARLDREIAEAKREEKRLREELTKARFSELVITQQERLSAEVAELSELRKNNILNSDQLLILLEDAFEEKDRMRINAILKKLAMDANFNEVLNYYGYPSNMAGMHAFFNEKMIKQLGMDEQLAWSLENDISYMCEGVNHWDQARLVSKDSVTGLFYQMSEEEHVASALAEIRKRTVRNFGRDANRLAYGGEYPVAGGREFHLSALGVAICLEIGEAAASKVKDEFNPNAAAHLYNNREILKRAGVSENFIESLKLRIESIKTSSPEESVRVAMATPKKKLPPDYRKRYGQKREEEYDIPLEQFRADFAPGVYDKLEKEGYIRAKQVIENREKVVEIFLDKNKPEAEARRQAEIEVERIIIILERGLKEARYEEEE